MCAVVSAVVGRDDDKRAFVHVVVFHRIQQQSERVIILFVFPQLLFRHPAVLVPGEVAIGEVHEHESESLTDLYDRHVLDGGDVLDLVGRVDEAEEVGAARLGDLTQFLLSRHDDRPQAIGMGKVEEVGAECISVIGHVLVPADNMLCGAGANDH